MKKYIISILIVSSVAALVASKKYHSLDMQATVTISPITEEALSDSILASGNLMFNNQIQIRSEVTGRVTQVMVVEGETVVKDQILLRLDDTNFNAQVSHYQAAIKAGQLDIAQQEEQRADLSRQLKQGQKLLLRGLIQQDLVASLTSQLKIADIKIKATQQRLNQSFADLKRAEDNLNKTVFRAPMNGLMSTVDVKVGETVVAGTTNIIGSPLMTLVDPNSIMAELRVDEADISNVHVGQEARVFSATYPKVSQVGTVSSIATTARTTSTEGLYFLVKILLKPSAKKLFPGMSCRAEIITQVSAKTINVPIAAVQQQEEQYFVWLVNQNIATKRLVDVGQATDLKQAILKGLSIDDVVITGPSRVIANLKEGDSIQIQPLPLEKNT